MKIGLALSGGGIRGAAHIGAIKALEENGISIEAIGGTSSGSIVSSLYAMGYNSEEMYNLFKYYAKTILAIGPRYLVNNVKDKSGFYLDGITSSKNISIAVQEAGEYKKIKTIEDLKTPIVIPTVDLITGKEYIFTNKKELSGNQYIHEIKIGDAARASSTFPGMYGPFIYKQFQFIDGGVMNNLPVKEVKKLGEHKVIAIKFAVEHKKYNSIHNIALRALDVMNETIIQEQLESADYLLNLELKGAQVFNINKLDFCYQQGYLQTIEKMSEIKKCINKIGEEK